MELTCNWCNRKFTAKRYKRCCSPEHAEKRRAQSIQQMREKKGPIYDTWLAETKKGMALHKANNRKKKGG